MVRVWRDTRAWLWRRIYIRAGCCHNHSRTLSPALQITAPVAYTFRILAIGGIAFNLALAASTGNDKHFVQTFDKHSLSRSGSFCRLPRPKQLCRFGKQQRNRDARRKRGKEMDSGMLVLLLSVHRSSLGCIPWGVRSPRRPLYRASLFFQPLSPMPCQFPLFTRFVSSILFLGCPVWLWCSYCPIFTLLSSRSVVQPLFIVHLCVIFPLGRALDSIYSLPGHASCCLPNREGCLSIRLRRACIDSYRDTHCFSF